MTTDPKQNVMYQVKDRLLEKIGESGEIEGNEVLIYGVTEEEWNNEENRSLVMDEPGVEPDVEEEGSTYTLRIDFSD